MKGRLLLLMIIMAAFMLYMYFKLCKLHPELISGFIVLISVAISHILNSAEDILDSLFKTPGQESPKSPIVAPQTPQATGKASAGPLCIVAFLLMFGLSSCAPKLPNVTSNLKVSGTGVVTPYGTAKTINSEVNINATNPGSTVNTAN